MLSLLADENLNSAILRGLIRLQADLDILRVQDVGLSSKDDPVILEWAANENRVLLTHDVSTITALAFYIKTAPDDASAVCLIPS